MTHIVLYHGSNVVVSEPRILPVNRPMDFGVGFYTTTFRQQAVDWARKKAVRSNGVAVVSEYVVDMSMLKSNCSVKAFRGTSKGWLDFVLLHRKAETYIQGIPTDKHHKYDVVMGEVADDQVYEAIADYERGDISRTRLEALLKFKKRNDQFCFSTTRALIYLKFNNMFTWTIQ